MSPRLYQFELLTASVAAQGIEPRLRVYQTRVMHRYTMRPCVPHEGIEPPLRA